MTGPRTFQKKPIQIRAMPWTGDNFDEIIDFATRPANGGGRNAVVELLVPLGDMNDLQYARECIGDDTVQKLLADGATAALYVDANCQWLGIENGEWIIEDENGLYPCKAATFERTYEPITTL